LRLTEPYKWLLWAVFAAASVGAALILAKLHDGVEAGSYEYVRKAQDLFDKGKTGESIRYMEKAYEASGDNKDIQANLINAYSAYSSELIRSGDHDKAVEFMQKAAEIREDRATMQNLAIAYSKRAVRSVKNKDLAGAKADFENARNAASQFEAASEDLAISLFNDGAEEFRMDRADTAVLFLKESSLARENPLTYRLLGNIYYKKTEYRKARFYFGKALSADPKDKAARRDLQKVTKEIRLSGREESRGLAHFELRYDKGILVNADIVKEVMERCYADVGKDLGYYPGSKTVVFLYTQKDFRDIFKVSSMTRAFYDGNIRIPLPDTNLSKEEFSEYLYHEYTHAVVSALTENNCTIWFNEGLAVRQMYKAREAALSGNLGRFIDKAEITIAALDNAFADRSGDEEKLGMYYLVAYTAVKYIVDSWGLEGIRSILKRIKSGQHVINAIDDEFLLSEKEFEKRWREYVAGKYLQ